MNKPEDRRVEDLQNALLDLVKRINTLERRINELEAAQERRESWEIEQRGRGNHT